MQKVLLICNADSIWTKEYVKHIHLPLSNQVEILSFEPVNADFLHEYADMGVTIHILKYSAHVLDKAKKITWLLHFFHQKNRFNAYDLVELHGPKQYGLYRLLYRLLNRYKGRLITLFHGSEILRLSPENAPALKPLLSRSTRINLQVLQLKEAFIRHYGHVYDEKIACVRLGSLAYDAIDRITEDEKTLKAKFGLDPEKVIVAVGHNGYRAQQHLPVLDVLCRLDEEHKEKIQLLVHIAYGAKPGYDEELKKKLETTDISYVLSTQTFDLHEIARLRMATDILIHAQLTDALSSTIREMLYAGKVLVNPSWIHYHEFDSLGVQYVKYDHIDELPELLTALLDHRLVIDMAGNHEIMGREFSWQGLRADWNRLLQGVDETTKDETTKDEA